MSKLPNSDGHLAILWTSTRLCFTYILTISIPLGLRGQSQADEWRLPCNTLNDRERFVNVNNLSVTACYLSTIIAISVEAIANSFIAIGDYQQLQENLMYEKNEKT